MLLSEKRATRTIKPWWDVFYFYSLVVILVLGTLLFLVRHGSFSVQQIGAKGKKEEEEDDDDVAFPTFGVYTITLFAFCWLLDAGFTRIFYNSYTVQILCHIVEQVTDVKHFKNLDQALIFANTFHHSNNRKYLWYLFLFHNAARLAVTLFAFGVVIQFEMIESSLNLGEKYQGLSLLAILISMVIVFQLFLLLYANLWPWLMRRSTWGTLMRKYSNTVDKIDISSGRRVPSPVKRDPERVLEALNPYQASPNVKLVLDLMSCRVGVGVALKMLAFLETDVQKNWRPFRLHCAVEGNSLEVTWKDPLAVLYLMPVPKEFRLYFAIEVQFLSHEEKDGIVEIIGYDETRYYQQVWNASHPSVVDLRANDSFLYHQEFQDICAECPIEISVWTVVDGQLIAKSSRMWEPASEAGSEASPNMVPKPPRYIVTRAEEESGTEKEEYMELSPDCPEDFAREYKAYQLLHRSNEGGLLNVVQKAKRLEKAKTELKELELRNSVLVSTPSVSSLNMSVCSEENRQDSEEREDKEKEEEKEEAIVEKVKRKKTSKSLMNLTQCESIKMTLKKSQSQGMGVTHSLDMRRSVCANAFSRSANQRKSLQLGELNLGYEPNEEDEEQPSFMI